MCAKTTLLLPFPSLPPSHPPSFPFSSSFIHHHSLSCLPSLSSLSSLFSPSSPSSLSSPSSPSSPSSLSSPSSPSSPFSLSSPFSFSSSPPSPPSLLHLLPPPPPLQSSDGPSASSFISPRKTGWLYKHGGSGVSSHWRKRWFIVDHHYLFYYKGPNVSTRCLWLCCLLQLHAQIWGWFGM